MTANIIGKGIVFGMKLLRRNATFLPGRIVARICPDYLEYIKRPKHYVAVTGTNGKTTSANLILDVLKTLKIKTVNNSYGSNTKEGVIATFLSGSRLNGTLKADWLVLEIDERSALHIINRVVPDYLLVTNLFRDSAQRNAHTDFIQYVIEKALDPRTDLIVNCDDCISSYMAPEHGRVGYGVAKLDFEYENIKSNVNDLENCPVCDHALEADFIRHHHIGRYHCPNCGFRNRTPEYETVGVDTGKMTLHMKTPAGERDFPLIGDNITDITNETGVIATLSSMGLPYEKIAKALKGLHVTSSRFESVEYKGLRITLALAKGRNPVASSRVFDYLMRSPTRKAVILVNSKTERIITKGDDDSSNTYSENTGWLYEVDFEYLNDDRIKQVIVGGKRYLDYVPRLLMAGLKEEQLAGCYNALECAEPLKLDDIDEVCILFDLYNRYFATHIRDEIKKRLDYES